MGVLTRSEDKSLSFVYAGDIAPEHRISMSLPITSEPYSDADCRGYFANLLFEGPQLERVLDGFGLDRGDIGALLWHLGADCPGAISITPEGTGPGKMPGRFPEDYERLSEARLHQIVLSLHRHRRMPEGERNPSPVAGVQGKIACLMLEGAVWLPKGGSRAPTTHILKVSPHFDPDVTRQETILLQIASEIGIDAAETRDLVFDVGGTHINALLSTRFDRDIEIAEGAGTIRRRHAEDFCQALGLPPSLKYERDAVDPHRRFSAAAVNVIAAQTTVPALVTRDFLAQTIFNLLVGNTDNHGKNTSLLYRGRTVLLAPLYDVAPVFMDRRVTHEFAFRHGSARFAEDFDVDALRGLLSDLGFGKPPVERAMKQIQQLAKRISELSARHAPKGLVDGLHAQARVLEDALDVDFGLEERDYYDRVVRDEAIEAAGGWGTLS
ncbi:HipA domain-containing protein [Cereibacter sphaeroides]|uniref:HipA domain-containing protein n=2 Tax=Cereibacter sphaeroides TaxID=1063 RepID=UPI00030E3DBB|nr:HipA domain-containing protein [Cereibacter sphaeroides]